MLATHIFGVIRALVTVREDDCGRPHTPVPNLHYSTVYAYVVSASEHDGIPQQQQQQQPRNRNQPERNGSNAWGNCVSSIFPTLTMTECVTSWHGRRFTWLYLYICCCCVYSERVEQYEMIKIISAWAQLPTKAGCSQPTSSDHRAGHFSFKRELIGRIIRYKWFRSNYFPKLYVYY